MYGLRPNPPSAGVVMSVRDDRPSRRGAGHSRRSAIAAWTISLSLVGVSFFGCDSPPDESRTPTPVASAGATVAVPAVIGLPLEEAMDVLETSGLAVGEVTYSPAEQPPGSVLAQDPSPGAIIGLSTHVDLVVAA